MSAYIVSKRHIDAIVTAAVNAGLGGGKTPDQLGDMLWRENVVSVCFRYRESTLPDVFYRFEPNALNDPWSLIKQIDCYEYQSCEHDAWEASEAFALVEALRAATLQSLGMPKVQAIYQMEAGWKDAPWGID